MSRFLRVYFFSSAPSLFSSWNLYHCTVDATILTETATAMVKTGLKDAGYVFVNSGEFLYQQWLLFLVAFLKGHTSKQHICN